MLPYVEVTNLGPAASFYSAVTHPLGLRYISASPGAIIYGAPSPTDPSTTNPVFEVRSVGDRAEPRKNARLVLSAHSPSVVKDFHAAALRAYPDLLAIGGAEGPAHRHSDDPAASGNYSASICDLDGNIMEVVYLPPAGYPADYNGSTVRRTSSTTDEVSRILDWNHDVAISHPSKSLVPGSAGGARTAVARRPSADAEGEPFILRRSVTTSTIETSPSPRENSSGLSANAIIGTVLGAVAAGAAIGGAVTYMNMKNQRDRAPRQDFEAPAFQRRSTEPMAGSTPRYVERTVEKIYYQDQLPPVKSRYYPPPSYMAKYSQVGGQSREVEELDDRASRCSMRSSKTRTRSEAGSTRRPLMIADAEYRSNAGSKYTVTPKMLMDSEYRSHAGSLHASQLQEDLFSRAASKHTVPRSMSHHPPEVETYVSSRSKSHAPDAETYISSRSKSYVPDAATYVSSKSKSHAPTHASSRSKAHAPDASTYVSSRSRRSELSESTIKPVKQSVVYGDIPIRSAAPSKAPSRYSVARSSATAMKAPARSTASRTPSRYPAAIPLPGSQADWSDNDSIAPSDSISCIGSRR